MLFDDPDEDHMAKHVGRSLHYKCFCSSFEEKNK